MQIVFETPKLAGTGLEEADALAQALEEVAVLHAALKELVPVERHPPPDCSLYVFGFDYTDDGHLRAITATARPERLDS